MSVRRRVEGVVCVEGVEGVLEQPTDDVTIKYQYGRFALTRMWIVHKHSFGDFDLVRQRIMMTKETKEKRPIE